jgi:hypothetical protein
MSPAEGADEAARQAAHDAAHDADSIFGRAQLFVNRSRRWDPRLSGRLHRALSGLRRRLNAAASGDQGDRHRDHNCAEDHEAEYLGELSHHRPHPFTRPSRLDWRAMDGAEHLPRC